MRSIFEMCRISTEQPGAGEVWVEGPAPPAPDEEPIYLDPVHAQAYEKYRDRYWGATEVYRQAWVAGLADAVVVGPEGIVLDAHHEVVSEWVWSEENLLKACLGIEGDRTVAEVEWTCTGYVKGPACLLVAPYSRNYYHWMNDTLPRLALYQPLLETSEASLVVPTLEGFIADTLAAAGVPLERVVALGSQVLRFEQLYLASAQHGYMEATPRSVAILRRWFLPLAVQSRPGLLPATIPILYISRTDVGRRTLANEEALLTALEPYGVQRMSLAGMTVRAQALAFARASVVLAPHGAGLTNIVFCRPGALVIELLPESWVSLVYCALARAAGLRYTFLLCPSSGQEGQYEASMEPVLRLVRSALGEAR